MATLTATLEPERMAVKLTFAGLPAAADTFTIERVSPSGTVAGVRGAVDAPAATNVVVRDYEIPFDVTVTYSAVAYDGSTAIASASASFRVEYDDCEAWLVDLARPTNSLPVVIESLVELAFESPTGVHHVLGRRAPVLTTLPAWTPAMELVLLTETELERDAVRVVFGSGYPFLLRTAPEQGIGNLYLGLTSFVEERPHTRGDDWLRRFRASCLQVERPDPAFYVPTPPNTYANVFHAFPTYAALKAGVATYDELGYLWPPGSGLAPVIPWLPDDV